MIIETVAGFCARLLVGLFSGLSFLSLPLDLISVLYSFVSVGVFVVGADVLSLFATSVMLWWGIHFSVGLAVWVYDHIPFV